MSQENVELVQRYIEAIRALVDEGSTSKGRRLAVIELPEAAAIFKRYWHPQAVRDVSVRPDGGIYHGPEGVHQSMRDWLAAWEDFDIDHKEFLSAGDRVVVVQDLWARAEDGMEVEWRDLCVVFTVRDGQFVHYQEHMSRAEALAAARLPE